MNKSITRNLARTAAAVLLIAGLVALLTPCPRDPEPAPPKGAD